MLLIVYISVRISLRKVMQKQLLVGVSSVLNFDLCFLWCWVVWNLRCVIQIMIQFSSNVVIIRVISSFSVLCGSRQFSIIISEVIILESSREFIGMLCLLMWVRNFGVLFCIDRLNSIWLLEYMLLLYIDSEVIRMMKFSVEVIRLLFRLWKIIINGLLLDLIFIYGQSVSSIISELIQNSRI